MSFPRLAGLRPTADRVRETLFNWLQPLLPGASCLDLFAGSGALGFEAASRGAASVLLLEKQEDAVDCLRENRRLLGLEQLRIEQADALTWLRQDSRPFDIVFLDPPFDAGLLEECCRLLDRGGWLNADARIYLESAARDGTPAVPASWSLLRAKQAGEVAYYLYTV